MSGGPVTEPDPNLSAAISTSSTVAKRSADEAADTLGDDIPELIRKAKAPRPTPKESDDLELSDAIRQELQCPICTEVYLDPVLCLPCAHSYCGACLKTWFDVKEAKCPKCRQTVKEAKPYCLAAALVEALSKSCPDQRRSEEEITHMRAIYQAGQPITLRNFGDPYDSEEDEPQRIWHACPCCDPNNTLGHTCPNPIIHDYFDFSALDVYRGHTVCRDCSRTVPLTFPRSVKCDGCMGAFCCGIHPPLSPFEMTMHEEFAKFSDWDPCRDREDFRKLCPNNFNGLEQNIVAEHVTASLNGDWKSLGRMLRDYVLRNDNSNPDGSGPLAERYFCGCCCRERYARFTMQWWIAYKEEINFSDPRERCWYGYECRTQFRPEHAQKLNHAMPPLPEHLRHTHHRTRARGPFPYQARPMGIPPVDRFTALHAVSDSSESLSGSMSQSNENVDDSVQSTVVPPSDNNENLDEASAVQSSVGL